jgi:hypothetical protein
LIFNSRFAAFAVGGSDACKLTEWEARMEIQVAFDIEQG